jgi:NAD-dependent dihydropyrimidine dehydrogenase PreA subunit
VLELLGSSVDLSLASPDLKRHMRDYGARPERLGGATVAQPVKVDNDLYVRDYSQCVLCYKCVEACGTDAQNTFAIAVAGRGFDAASRPSPIGRCPIPRACTAATASASAHRRADVQVGARHAAGGTWDESKQR